MKLEALTPRDDLNEGSFKVYKHYLDQAFENPKIRNLALSGSLGSGKSSIIRSYDRTRHEGEKHFIYVSLMDFSKQNPKKDATTQKHLEYSLLNQIMSYCTKNELPEGSISGIPEKFNHLKFCAGCLSALCFAVYMLIFHEQFGEIASRLAEFRFFMFISDGFRSGVHLCLYLLIGLSLSYCTYCILCRCLPFFHLSKLTLKANNAEAEVLMGKDRTSLDVHKFELAYTLEQIAERHDYTVVFEDLERLDPDIATDIMEKLRELNTLTNNHLEANRKKRISVIRIWDRYFSYKSSCTSLRYFLYELHPHNIVNDTLRRYYDKISTNTPIRFIYAIDDSTITVEHRTKFYDCIVPIVPESNPLNGKDQLSKLLGNLSINEPYRKKLCDSLSEAILDYRTRLTLKNEFNVLWTLSKQKETEDNSSKPTMFAIAAYKVLIPQCFEYALSPNGIGQLPEFNSHNDDDLIKAYPKEDQRKSVFKAISSLQSNGLLNKHCLRFIVGEKQLMEHWLNILQKTLTKETLDTLDKELAEHIIPAVATGFPKAKFGELYKDFRKTMIPHLHKLVSPDDGERFVLVARSLSAVSNISVLDDWKWLIPSTPKPDAKADIINAHKWYLTHTIRYLVVYQEQSSNDFISIKDLLGQSLTDFCQNSTTLMTTHDMAQVFKWNHDMGKMLATLLPCGEKKAHEHKHIAWDNQTQRYRTLGDYRKG